MKLSDFLVEFLGQNVYLTAGILIVVSVSPKFDLGKYLVGKRARHNEGRMASGATEVHKTAAS